VFDRLRAVPGLRVAPWARIVSPASAGQLAGPDELRLLVLPRVVMPGVVGVEVGRAWSATPAGWAGTPEVLVRVLEGSSAAAKLAQVLPRARSTPGRRTDERVVRLRPRRGTRAGTVALTQGLAEALTDRRRRAEGPTAQNRRAEGPTAQNRRAEGPTAQNGSAEGAANPGKVWEGPTERRMPRPAPPRAPAGTPMAEPKAC
jgi:hypothetical protein